MDYKIIAIHSLYQNGRIEELAVLWESNPDGSTRATYMTTKPASGYLYLKGNESISDELIQQTAGYGMSLPDGKFRKYFSK